MNRKKDDHDVFIQRRICKITYNLHSIIMIAIRIYKSDQYFLVTTIL